MTFLGFIQDWAGVLAIVVSIAGGFYQLNKTKAETEEKKASYAQIATDSATKLIDPLNKRIEDLECEVKRLSEENITLRRKQSSMQTTITELSAGVAILSGQIISLGHKPKWKPDGKEEDPD